MWVEAWARERRRTAWLDGGALRSRLSRERSILGYNIAALGFVKRIVEDESNKFFVDAVAEMEERARSSSTAELRRKTAAREGCGRAKKRKGRN